VHDLKIHLRDHELMAATHGRSLWVVNIAPLEQLNATVLAANAHLFQPRTAYQWGEGPAVMQEGNGNAQAFFATPSPTYGADITYRLAAAVTDTVRVRVFNAAGDTVAIINGPNSAGLHTVSWNFARRAAAATRPALSPSEKRDSILRAARAPVVLDSLGKAGYDTLAISCSRYLLQPAESLVAQALAAGRGGRGGAGGPPAGCGIAGFGGGGGGGRGGRGAANCERPLTQWDPFCARAAEAEGRGGR